jgi:antitoxin CptB
VNEKSKLLWHCRRGIREMDILFREFIEQHYDDLSDDDKQSFSKLLDEADLDILNWIMGKDTPDTDELKNIISIIRQSRQLN